jgi:L-methionine (R)-S-oxide reductase
MTVWCCGMNISEKREAYERVIGELDSVLENETDGVASMATIACLLKQNFPYYYWVGFYRWLGDELVIGPYQGTPGCLRISLDRGVCGAAARERKTQSVKDVHQFPGHIACDPASRSEIVVPVMNAEGQLLGVLDVDSDRLAAFDEVDREYLEKLVSRFFLNARSL